MLKMTLPSRTANSQLSIQPSWEVRVTTLRMWTPRTPRGQLTDLDSQPTLLADISLHMPIPGPCFLHLQGGASKRTHLKGWLWGFKKLLHGDRERSCPRCAPAQCPHRVAPAISRPRLSTPPSPLTKAQMHTFSRYALSHR